MKYYSEDTVKKIIPDTVNATLHICKPKEDYPCIEIKEPHGRLIDADLILACIDIVKKDYPEAYKLISGIIERTPTIIEASKERE